MSVTTSVSPEALNEIETGFRAAWTGAKSTPFIVDAPIGAELRKQAEDVVTRLPLSVLFLRCPTLAVWAVLTPLARNYGASTKDVYLHITHFVNESLDEQYERDDLKHGYRTAARKVGLPVAGNDPNALFFVPLGPPRSRHGEIADAFVATALALGPPAIEDTPSARDWQRRAVRQRCPSYARLHKTIDFDRSAHCARRFEAWRKGSEPLNDNEAALFEAYDHAAARYGRKRSDLTGPPQLYWSGDRLAVEAERSSQVQFIKAGAFPVQIKGGSRLVLDAPWPDALPWRCGPTERDVPFGPKKDQVLIFDADSGALLSRTDITAGVIEVAASRLVILSRQDFETPSFGPSMPASDPSCRVAWITTGEALTFSGGEEISIITPKETAIWLDARAIGHAGSRALITGDGALVVKLDPEIGGRNRIVRARLGDTTKFTNLTIASDGTANIPLESFGFSANAAPCKAVFEILAPGAAGDFEARAELSVSSWLWPGLRLPSGALLDLPRPSNFDPARSAGLRASGDRLEVDLAADIDAPILGLSFGDETHEFVLRTGAEVLHHHRLARQDKVVVPRGARIFLGHEARHDALILQSADRDADLLVLGRVLRRPFFARSRFEITPEMLEAPEQADDRIALRRSDGRMEVFARIERRDDPAELKLEEDDAALVLTFLPQQRCDALRVQIDALQDPAQQGDYTFGRHLADLGSLPGIEADQDIDSGRLTIRVDKKSFPHPARMSLWTRHADRPGFQPLKDGRGTPISAGLGLPLADPDGRSLGALAKLAAEPVSAHLEDQHARSLNHAYFEAMARLGERRLVGAIKPALAATCPGATPRHDLAGIAPWIFEASPHAFQGLPDGCGLSALSRTSDLGAAKTLPDPDGDVPLASWLERLGGEDDLPDALCGPTLASAFGALRFRLKESDLKLLLSEDRHGMACACICSSWTGDIEALRAFDAGGGGDNRPARIAAAIERFARACALGRASTHIDDLVFRTGLPRAELGECLTLMLRAGIEVFVYFRALWMRAVQVRKDDQ
ncbi:MAG: hypothetical protein ACJASC_003511 [Limimaricola cinnabarinus]|jgi:hypothetical protein|uniref:hypothetical protein n=1 Tax=Limimaricola cinnabarinus TaxID=1125964 RepID=UPI0039E4E484